MPGLKGSLFVYQLKSDRISVSGDRIECDKNQFIQYRFKNFEVACESKEPSQFVLEGYICQKDKYLRYADEHGYLAKHGYVRLVPCEGFDTFMFTRKHLVIDFSSLFVANDAMIAYYTAPSLKKNSDGLPPNVVDNRFLYVYAPFNGLLNEAQWTNHYMANLVDEHDNTMIGRSIYATPVEYEAVDVHVSAQPQSSVLYLDNTPALPVSGDASATDPLFPL